jgi:hypothetical protein
MSISLPSDPLTNHNIRECILIAASQFDHWQNNRKKYTRTSSACRTMFNLCVSPQYLKENKLNVEAALLTFQPKTDHDVNQLKVLSYHSLHVNQFIYHSIIIVCCFFGFLFSV